MDFPRLRPDLIKYEVRSISGESIQSQQQKRPGGFARFLSGVGRFFGAVAAPLSVIFPPAIFGALGAMGLSRVGDAMQRNTYQRMMEKRAKESGPMFVPEISQNANDLTRESALVQPISEQDRQLMGMLMAKNDLMLATAQEIKKV